MGDQQRLPGTQSQDESLVSRTFIVIRKDTDHFTATAYLLAWAPLLTARARLCGHRLRSIRRYFGNQVSLVSGIRDDDDEDVDEFFHLFLTLMTPVTDFDTHSIDKRLLY